jgi:hypothetical protein
MQIGGKTWCFREFTLRELALLQSWLDSSVHQAETGKPPVSRAELLAAWRHCREGAPDVFSSAAANLFCSANGPAVELLVMLRTCDESVTAAVAREMAATLSCNQWQAIREICWGVERWRVLAAALDPDWAAAQLTGSQPVDWGEQITRLVLGGGWTFAKAGQLHISQWRLLCRNGRADHYRTIQKEGELFEDWIARSLRIFADVEDQNA